MEWGLLFLAETLPFLTQGGAVKTGRGQRVDVHSYPVTPSVPHAYLTSAGLGPSFLFACFRLLLRVTAAVSPCSAGLPFVCAICIRLQRAKICEQMAENV